MTHDEMIDVITHHKNGGKVQGKGMNTTEWCDIADPLWEFSISDYRAKPEPKYLSVIWDETNDQILTYVGISERDETLFTICKAKLPELKLTLKKFVEVTES